MINAHSISQFTSNYINNIVAQTKQFINYTMVGIAATLTHYITLYILVDALGLLSPVLASSLGFIFGATVGFICNSKLVFRQAKSGFYELSKYATLAAINCLNNSILMYIFVNELRLFYLHAQLLCTGLLFVSNYFVCKYWIFKTRENVA